MRRLLGVPVLALVLSGIVTSSAGADDLDDARRRANQAASELAAAETTLGTLEGEITALEARAADAQARLDRLRSSVRDVAVEQFINADATGLQTPDADLNEQVRADALGRAVTQGNQDAIDDFVAASEDLEVATAELEGKKEQQRAAVDELRDRRAELQAELARLEEIQRKRQEAQRRQEAARRAVARSSGGSGSGGGSSAAAALSTPSAPIASGSWICPVQGPVAFSDTWGAPRSGGRRHKGVDMLSPTGTPTVAPVGGRVEHRGNSVGGLSWHLYGDDGNYYYGTHLSAYGNSGRVAAGTVIGYVGDTGNARGTPHLHFEIHPNGAAAVNPYPTVARHC